MIDQFQARLSDIKSVVDYTSQLNALKWAMGEMKKSLIAEEAASVAALDHWHNAELTSPKPVVVDHTADKAKLDNATTAIDSIVASMAQTVSQLDQAIGDLT